MRTVHRKKKIPCIQELNEMATVIQDLTSLLDRVVTENMSIDRDLTTTVHKTLTTIEEHKCSDGNIQLFVKVARKVLGMQP